MTGYKADYQLAVGFSQAQGLLRGMKFDATKTLQFLRHRQSYAIGDNQRSYNQSVFLSDLFKDRIDLINSIPQTAQFALFQFIDTDMPYPVAKEFLKWASETDARTVEGRIVHKTLPAWSPKAREIHLDEENEEQQLETLYAHLKLYKPEFKVINLEDTVEKTVDNSISNSYNSLIKGDIKQAREHLDEIANQQIWNQIDNNKVRINDIEAVAILDSTITWYESHNEEKSLELATQMIWSLELEEGTQDTILRIKDHLTKLLS